MLLGNLITFKAYLFTHWHPGKMLGRRRGNCDEPASYPASNTPTRFSMRSFADTNEAYGSFEPENPREFTLT